MSEITKQEMGFRPGWYKSAVKGMGRLLVYHNFEKGLKFGINILGDWIYDDDSMGRWYTNNLAKATYQEVESMLKAEAEKRGFKKGATFNHEGLGIYCADDNIYLKNNALYYGYFPIMENGVWAEIVNEEGKKQTDIKAKEVLSPQQHYDNSKGSLYKLADELGLNHYEFDILKLLIKDKDNLKNNLQEMKKVINLYLDSFEK